MPAFETIIRNGTIVTATEIRRADIGIIDGKIAAIAKSLSGSASEEIDATNLHIFPGVIDAHVHFNEPGRTHWEGIETGSRALAAGGGTMFFDMPLNAHPPTCDADSFDLKRKAAEAKSVTDFALWGGLVPGNLKQLGKLAKRGVIGFKAFMSNSGIEDFSSVDDKTLRAGMKIAAQLNLPVAVHAESDTMTAALSQKAIAEKSTTIRDYLNSRPIAAELDAIRRAIAIAAETGCALHVVHVSSAAGVQMVTAAHNHGINVTCETCPHYLVLTDEDVEKLGAVAKCAPPLRSKAEQGKLWAEVLNGNVLTIGSDHSPAPPKMKTSKNFFKVWGGISGVQHMLPLLIDSVAADVRRLTLISAATSSNIAARFNLPKSKGKIEIGCDADFVLVSTNKPTRITKQALLYRHQQSPYIGRKLKAKVLRTILRGQTIFQNGKIIAKARGRLIKPLKTEH
ncbi:MAG: allantoinase [Verrucomicrobiales bacterium]|nr:allantoinase [Verrucomicrobiales bacterium]